MSKVLKTIVNVILFCAIVVAAGLLIPPFAGITTVMVDDVDMQTNLPQGSVAYAVEKDRSELKQGDKVLISQEGRQYVYVVDSIDGSSVVLDDQLSTDGGTTQQELGSTVQKVMLVVPVIGYVSMALRSTEGLIIVGLAVVFVIILFILAEVWKKDDDEEEDEENEDAQEDESEEEQEEELHDLISNKNYFGVTEFAETLSLNDNLKALFGMLGNLYTGSDELQTAKKYASEYPRILAAIERLEELHQVLKIYGIDKYVSVELGIVSNYQYYTGIIFAGYTFGNGEPIVKGGRYDELLTYFGKESASIGFAIVIDQLMAALSRQKIEIPVQYQNELIIYDSKMRSEAIKKAMELRTDGRNVELMARDISKTEEDYRTYAKQNHFVNVTFM